MGKTKKNNPKAVKAVTEDRKKGLKRAPEAEAKAVPLSKKSKKNKPIPPQKQQKKKIKRPPQKLEESDDPSEDEEMEALSEEDNSEEDVEVPASKPKKQGKMVQKTSDDEDEAEDIDEGSESGDEDGSDDDEDIADEDDDENGEVAEPPSKNGSAVKQDGPNKTIFVKNLPFDLEEDTVKDFFKKAGEVAEIRLKKGFGHVEFTTEGAVQKALKFSGQSLGGRNIVCEVARGSGRDEPNGAKRGGETGGGKTIFVKGFDKSQEEEEIRTSLQNHFSDCGAMGAIRIPTDQESGYIKGFAYIEFNEPSSCAKALQKNGSDLDGQTLVVDSAGERSSRGGRGGGGRGGFGGGRGGGFGGGRGGRGGGRGFGGGRGGGRGRGGGGRGRGGGGRGRR